MMPYHKNEQPNFKQKLNTAISDLKQKCADKVGKKAIFMRLHQTANMEGMKEYANDLMNEQGCAADLIVLYQPAYINDSNLTQTTPSQYFCFLKSANWDENKYPIKMKAVIAQHIINPSKQKMVWPDGSLKDPPRDHYMYSTGQYFVATKMNEKLEGTVTMRRKPNLSLIPVYQGVPLVGVFPPNDEFLVL